MSDLKAFANIELNATPTANNHLVTVSYLNNHFLKMESVAPEWDSSSSGYGVGAIVRYNGGLYKSLSANNNATPTNTSKWAQTYITALADSNSYGLVKPDATSISINDGTISAVSSRKRTVTTTGTIALSDDISVYRVQASSGSVTISFSTSGLTASTSDYDIEFTLVLTQGQSPTTYIFPNNLTWLGEEPGFDTASSTYFVKVCSYDGSHWFAYLVSYLESDGEVNGDEEETGPIEEPAALGRVVVVDTLSDAATHTGTSLRDAIDAVTDKGSVVIKFSVSGTITLEQGEIVIPVGNIAIDGEDKITISGGGVSRVFALTNAYAVLKLHRLTITGGNGVGATQSQTYGGAIIVTSASTIEACGVTFCGNALSGTAADVGGGVAHLSAGRGIFIDCEFDGNSATTTGSVCNSGCIYVSSASAHLHCMRCTFTDNTASAATTAGGAAVVIQNGIFQDCVFSDNTITGGTNRRGGAALVGGNNGTFQRCTFKNNSAGTAASTCAGGAFYCNTSHYIVIEDCIFENNTAFYGGGIYIVGTNSRQYYCRIERCLFDNNHIHASGRAAAVYCNQQSVTIEDCKFVNHSVGSASGVIYAYGYTGKLFVVTINRCKFTGNSASAATTGLVYCANLAQVYLYNTVFTANSFTATTGNHKCVYTTGSSNAFIYNCTFTNNTDKGGAFYAAGGGVDIYNSVEYGNGSASGKGTNPTVNAAKFLSDQSESVGRDIAYDSTKPLFADDGFTPVANSQVIDAGNNTYVMTEYDLLGKTRKVGTAVDLGAVEVQ